MNKEIDYLKEHLYEIYKYKKSMKDLTYDMDLEHLLRTCKALDYSQQEINRLNNIINECANEILKELQENHHLSYGVALSIRQKLINYNELKGDNK